LKRQFSIFVAVRGLQPGAALRDETFTRAALFGILLTPSAKLTCRRQVNQQEKNVMGDKSPKANQKKSGQKLSKSASAAASKQTAADAKKAAAKNR
jgi:hypothetical protein